MTAQRSDQKTAQQKSSSAPSDIETLVQWQFTEEKAKTTKDKDLLIGIVGATATVLSIMTKKLPICPTTGTCNTNDHTYPQKTAEKTAVQNHANRSFHG